ncbi:uncharacterized protein LOC129580803 isoform X2 [Paramacrobiotus metropolitanus]|uniref:uncharacterized protein LOC129580803 isoform X2 n=1 Tax=Paramacrobiotus metropolitanus TaxID=2943436 RepID=UPI0024458A0B|nr:uncharacterized protein LOC129580803 isoform X2 [Paramacrobiotus metropolitanus]
MELAPKDKEGEVLYTDDEDDVRSFCTVSSTEHGCELPRYCKKGSIADSWWSSQQPTTQQNLVSRTDTSNRSDGMSSDSSLSGASSNSHVNDVSMAQDLHIPSSSMSRSTRPSRETENSSEHNWQVKITENARIKLFKSKPGRDLQSNSGKVTSTKIGDCTEQNTNRSGGSLGPELSQLIVHSVNSFGKRGRGRPPGSTKSSKMPPVHTPSNSFAAPSTSSKKIAVSIVKPSISRSKALRGLSTPKSQSTRNLLVPEVTSETNGFVSILKTNKMIGMKRIVTDGILTAEPDTVDSDSETEPQARNLVQVNRPVSSKCSTRRKRCDRQFLLERDISDGTELFPIRVYNDINGLPAPSFRYSKNIIIRVPGYERTPCVCQCVTFCDARCHCMGEPFDKSITEIAYDEFSRLLRKASTWQSSVIANVPRSIWECSRDCSCGLHCPNRSAQLGVRYPFEIFMTAEKGWGVRPLCDLPAGAFVAEYAGELKEEADSDYWSNSTWYTFCLSADNGPTGYFLDASVLGNFTRFINHGCVPNVVAVNVFYDDSNPDCGMHVGMYTVRKIRAFQELTIDYGKTFWDAKMQAGEYCKCNSTKCLYRQPRSL